MTIETKQDLAGMRRVGKLVADILREMKKAAKIGMTTAELDDVARRMMEEVGARSAPQLFYDFPGVTCISVNEAAVHGIPNDYVLKAGDMVTCDVTAELDGYIADAALTLILPPVDALKKRLEACTRLAFNEAIKVARAGEPVFVIGRAIEKEVRRHGFNVLVELQSHGVGRHIHEEPSIPNFFYPQANGRLQDGMVITIEPIISAGSFLTVEDADGWTVRPDDGSLSAHYEHTMIITKKEPIILTA